MSLLIPITFSFKSDAELEVLERERLRELALSCKPQSNLDPLSALCDKILMDREQAKLKVQAAAFSAPALTVAAPPPVNHTRRPPLDSVYRESLHERRAHRCAPRSPLEASSSSSSLRHESSSLSSSSSPHSVVSDLRSRRFSSSSFEPLPSPHKLAPSATDDARFANVYLNKVKSLCLVNSKRTEMKIYTRKRIITFRGVFRYAPSKSFDPNDKVVRSLSHPQFFLSLPSKRGSPTFSKGGSNCTARDTPISPRVKRSLKQVKPLGVAQKQSFKPKTSSWRLADDNNVRTSLRPESLTPVVHHQPSSLLQDVTEHIKPSFIVTSRSRRIAGEGNLIDKVSDYLLKFYAGHHTFYDSFRSGEDVIRLSCEGDFTRMHCHLGGLKKVYSIFCPRYSRYFSAFSTNGDFSSFNMKYRPAEGFCYVEHLFNINLSTGRAFPFKLAHSLGAYPKAADVSAFASEVISDDLCLSPFKGFFVGNVFHCSARGDFQCLSPDTLVGGSLNTSPFNDTTTHYVKGKTFVLSGDLHGALPKPRQKRCFRCKSVDFNDSITFSRYVHTYVTSYVVAGGYFYDKFRNVDGSTITLYVRNLNVVSYLQRNDGVSCATMYAASEYVRHFGELILAVTDMANYSRAPKPRDGQCYLQFVFECCVGSGIPFDHRKATAALRTLPTLKCLMSYVNSLGITAPHYLRGSFKSRTLFHCDINSPFIVNVRSFRGCEVIGGLSDDSPSLVQDQELLQAVSNAIARSGASRDSLLVRSVETEAIRVNEAARNERNRRPEQVIPYQMSEERQAALVNAFPEFNLRFTHSTYSNHSLAASCRLLENSLHHRKAGSDYVDVGGCPKYHLMAGHVGVHICRPVCDLKDAQRKVLREHSISSMETLPHRLYDKVAIAGCGITACSRTLSECSVKSNCLVATQVYDLNVDDMAKAMRSRGASVFYFSLITPGEFLTDRDAFHISTLDVDVIVSRAEDRVTYVFGHTTYSHSFSNLLRFMQTSHFCFEGNLFSLEMYEVRCGVNFYQMTRSERCPTFEGVNLLRFPFAEPGITKVKIPRFDRQSRCCLPGADYMYLDSDFVEKIYLFTVNACQNVNSKTFDYVWNHIKNAKARLVISGKIVRRDVHLDINDIESFSAVMLAAGVRSRLTAECFSKKISLAVNEMSISSMLKYAVNEKLRHMRFLFRSKFTTLIKRICKDAFDIDFLEATDLITPIGTHSEFLVHVSLKKFGSIPENEETSFLSSQASRLIHNSLQRDLIVEVGDEIIEARAATLEDDGAQNTIKTKNPKNVIPKGGLKAGAFGSSVVEWLISSFSSLVVKTPAALRDCLRSAAKYLNSIELVPKFRKMLAVLLNPFIFDDSLSITVELLGKCFSKLLSVWNDYSSGNSSFRGALSKFVLSMIVDCSIGALHYSKPPTLLDSQMRNLLTDYISKAVVFGVSPLSGDGVLTLSGVLVTVFRKIVSRCLSEDHSCYAGYYNNNSVDSPLVSYLKRESRRMGLSANGYFKQLVKETLQELLSSFSLKECGKKYCDEISSKISDGASWLTSFFRNSSTDDDVTFFDSSSDDLNSEAETSDRAGLGGGVRLTSVLSLATAYFCFKLSAVFADFPSLIKELRSLSAKAELGRCMKLSVMIDRFIKLCSKWRGKKYANVVLGIGSIFYYISKFLLRVFEGCVRDSVNWVVPRIDSFCRLLVNSSILPKPFRKVLKGLCDIVRSVVYIGRVLIKNLDATSTILCAKLSGVNPKEVLARYSLTISLGLKACFFKDSRWIGTYVDINPKERCSGGVYYDFQSDISDCEEPPTCEGVEDDLGFGLSDDDNSKVLVNLNKVVISREEFAKRMGLFGGGKANSLISSLILAISGMSISAIKSQLLTSFLTVLCDSSCTVVGVPSLVYLIKSTSAVNSFIRVMRMLKSERDVINVCDYLLIFNNKFGFKFIETQLLRLRSKARIISENPIFRYLTKGCSIVANASDFIAECGFNTIKRFITLGGMIYAQPLSRRCTQANVSPSLSEEFEFSDEEEFSSTPGLKAGSLGNSIISKIVSTLGRLFFSKTCMNSVMYFLKAYCFKKCFGYVMHESPIYYLPAYVGAWLCKDQIYTKFLILSKIPVKGDVFDLINRFFHIFGDNVAIPDKLVIGIIKVLDVLYGYGVLDAIRSISRYTIVKFNYVVKEESPSGVYFSAVPTSKPKLGLAKCDLQDIIRDIEAQRPNDIKFSSDLDDEVERLRRMKGKGKVNECSPSQESCSGAKGEFDAPQQPDSSRFQPQSDKPDLVKVAGDLIHEVVDSQTDASKIHTMRSRERQVFQNDTNLCPYLKTLNMGVVTPSPFALATGKGSTLTNSVREFYYLQEVALFEIYTKCLKYYQEATVMGFDRKLLTCNEDSKLVLYDCSSRKMQMKNRTVFKTWDKVFKDDGYQFCFSSNGLTPFSDSKNRGKKVILHEDIAFLPQNLFLRALSGNSLKFTNIDVKLRLYEAPPGGGKTHTLIDLFVRSYKVVNALVLTANKNSQIEISRRIEDVISARPSESSVGALSCTPYVCTIDSYLMHTPERSCELLFVDECFMVHAGEVLAALQLTKCKVALLFGDSRQIHFIHRGELESSRFSDLNEFIDEAGRVYGDKSYRCPWDVCEWLSKYYTNKVASVKHESVGRSSCSIKLIECEDDIDLDDEVKFITFTQEEKHRLQHHIDKRRIKSTVNTVHEVQGETYKRVSLTRFKFQEDAPFSSMNHIIVALSRHTNSLVYNVLSARSVDKTCVEIEKIKKICEDFRCNPYTNTSHSYTVSGVTSAPDNFKSKPCSAPIEIINYWLDDVLPGCGFGDLGDPSEEMKSSPFECGVDNVVVTDAAPAESVSTQQRV
ncbi:ORF1A [Blackcurrant leafroll-associated virus 1]|uniref:ORF1A n=1 Tax=Blackcurrant leafroll-associated virus 1 TaxID=2292426 RepID=UPI000E331E14|nr:ORF1A [Blackcurrant leafroll-associated virus 1]AXN56986.1 ORF1A [Blackcurrant leafroll-associated virus 1]